MTLSKVKRNMPTKILGLAFVMLFCSLGIQAQNFFHRTYPATNGKEILSIAGAQLRDGNFVSVEMELDSTDMTKMVYSDTVIVTSYKPKGDVLWTQKIFVDEAMQGFTRAHGSVVQGDNDTIYFSLNVDATDKFNKIIGSVTNAGRFAKVRSFSTQVDSGDGNESGHYLANYNKSLFTAYTAIDTNVHKIALARRSYDGQNLWSKLIKPEDQDVFNVTDINVTVDTSLAIAGGVDSGFYYTVLDTLGNVSWSRKYRNVGANVIAANVKALPLTDSTFVVSLNNLADNSSHIISAAQNGDILWAKKLVMVNLDSSLIVDIALDINNDIIVGGSSFTAMDSSFKFMAKVTRQGNTLWKFGFPGVKADFNPYGSLFGTNDGGSAFVTSSVEENKLRPSFIKLISTGILKFDSIPSCNTMIAEDIFSDVIYTSDTLIWNGENRGLQDTVAFRDSINMYRVEELTLNRDIFCPNEPINWLYDASYPNAVDYLWSTGTNRNLDTLRVFDDAKYSVTVTVGKGVCYMLCDTVQLDRYELPQAQIGLSLGNWCTNGKQTLSLGYTPGHPTIKTITWSTGQDTLRSIEIGQPGTYSVTVVDNCDEVATAEIEVGEFPRKITAATISADLSVNCFEGEVTGTLTASGNSFGLPADTYLWSTGGTTKQIVVNDSPILTYGVTITDGCGTTAVATYTEPLEGDGISSVSISKNTSLLCLQKKLILNAAANINGSYTYLWSTGETSRNIEILTPGNYSVTVTDKCGNTASASISITAQDFIPPGFTVDIIVNSDKLCDDKVLSLIANPQPSSNTYTYLWSTGSTQQSIVVATVGNYIVTVTDQCGTVVVFNKLVSDPDFVASTFTLGIAQNTSKLCEERILGLIANPLPENKDYTYLWSTGATEKSIEVDMPGLYTVTVTDECGTTKTQSVDIRNDDLIISNQISNLRIISVKKDTCIGVFARAVFDNDTIIVASYLWSNGATTKEIDFTGKGTYSVTVTDECNNISTATAVLDIPDSIGIDYANVFFPDGIGATFELKTKDDTLSKEAHILNRSFGPINLPLYCLDDITDYEFYIFNRWGQQVFESKDIKVEWDGTNGDKKWQSDTYVWVVKYKIFGFEKTQKGDVTLIR
jgi:gliding motility-associated-like protein